MRQVPSDRVCSRVFRRNANGVVVSTSFHVVKRVREGARIGARRGGVRIMASTCTYPRNCLFQRDFRAGLQVEAYLILTRRPSIAHVRRDDSPGTLRSARAVFCIHFRARHAYLIRVEVLTIFQIVTAKAGAARHGDASAINAAGMRLFAV